MYSTYTAELSIAGTNQPAAQWPGGPGFFLCANIGSPAFLEFSIDGGASWFSVLGSAASAQKFELPPCLIKTTGGGGSLDAWAALI